MRVLIFVALLAVGCGDSTPYKLAGPSAVIPPQSVEFTVDGKWGGVVSVTIQGQRLSAPVAMSLDHQGDAIAGWWSALGVAENRFFAGQGVSGDIQGTVTGGAFAGTVIWDSNEGNCKGSAGLSGTITRGRLTFQAPSIPLNNCSAPSGFVLDVIPR